MCKWKPNSAVIPAWIHDLRILLRINYSFLFIAVDFVNFLSNYQTVRKSCDIDGFFVFFNDRAIIIRRRGEPLVRFGGRGIPSTSPRIPNTTSTNMGMYVIGTPGRAQRCLGCSRWGWVHSKDKICSCAVLKEAIKCFASGLYVFTVAFLRGWQPSRRGFNIKRRTSFLVRTGTLSPPRGTGLRFFMQLFWKQTKSISPSNNKISNCK